MRTKACIVKRKNVWSVKQPLPDGKYRWTTVGPRKRDAEVLRDELNRRVVLGGAYPTHPEQLRSFADAWLERHAQHVRPATLESAERSVAALAPFGNRTIESLTAAEIEDHVLGVARSTPRSAELMLDTMKAMLRNARQRGQRVDEEIFAIRAPRRERREMRFLNWTEVGRPSRRRRYPRTRGSYGLHVSPGCGKASSSPCARRAWTWSARLFTSTLVLATVPWCRPRRTQADAR